MRSRLIRYIIYFLILLFPLFSKAQNKNKISTNFKSKVIISVGHGIGNIWKTYLNRIINLPGIRYKIRSYGPYNLIGEYRLNNRISAGVAIGYSEIDGIYSGYGDYFKDRLTIFSILVRANVHFNVRKRWDVYAGGGAGYVNSQYDNSGSQSGRSAPPEFGYSGQIGGRFSINSRWGIYLEAGYVGGSFVQIGGFVSL